MKKLVRHLRWFWVVPLVISASIFAQPTSSTPVVIAELQAGSAASANDEFIELANVSDDSVDVSDWRLEYFSASAVNFTHPSRSIPLHGLLPPGEHYLLASNGYMDDVANDTFASTLSKTGGHIRLVSTDGSDQSQPLVRDLVGWGSALHPLGQAVPAPSDGSSLQRKTDLDTKKFVNTGNNKADFEISSPTPQGFIAEPGQPDNFPDPKGQTDDSGQSDNSSNNNSTTQSVLPLSPQITELLPNPAPPLVDSKDEFVELYNPSDILVELNNYKLQTGSNYTYSYTFKNESINAKGYKAFYASDTKLTLSNSAGKARLINADGVIVSETAPYESAPDGQAWVWDGASWKWSGTVTPNAANILSTLPIKTDGAAKPKTAKTPKVKAASTKKTAKKTKAKKAKPTAATGNNNSEDGTNTQPIHPAILAGVGGLTLLYAGYEYRHDMANAFYKLRRNRKASR